MSLHFLDTSAILNGTLNLFENIYISPLVLQELEHIKSSGTNAHTQYLARQAVRDIITSRDYRYSAVSQKQIDRLLKKYDFLSNINDHRMLCEALILNSDNQIVFVTSDGAQMLFAQELGLQTIYFGDLEEENTDYCGWSRHYPNEEQMAALYSTPNFNTLGVKTNEFCEIFEGDQLKDVLFWNGERYTNLKYSEFKNQLGEKIAPRNLEQKMLFHLLQNEEIKVKLCCGGFGDGKTFTMLQHALKGVRDGRFSKIIFVRNNIITKGSREIGFLSGSMLDKIKPYLMPIADLTTEDYLDELIETGVLEPVPLGFMRGRDFSGDVLVFVDEAENLLKENVQLLLGRIGIGSEIWFAGDLKQIDHKDFEKNNGINKMIQCLAGNKLFGMVKLIKSERSTTSQLADLLD